MSGYNLRAVLSDKCNYHCVFCSHDFNRCRGLDISPVFLKECMNVFAGLGGKKVTYTGGEPLIYPALYDVMRHAKSLGLANAITTNGSLLPLQHEEFYSLADTLNISVPSFNPKDYHRLTGSNTALYDIIDSAVKASEHGLRVKINMVYTGQNAGIIHDMAGILSPHGIIIKLMNDMIADSEYYREFLEFAEGFRNDKRVEIESARNPEHNMCRNCNIPHPTGCPSCRSIWLYPDGRITLCPFDGTGSFLEAGRDVILRHISGLIGSQEGRLKHGQENYS